MSGDEINDWFRSQLSNYGTEDSKDESVEDGDDWFRRQLEILDQEEDDVLLKQQQQEEERKEKAEEERKRREKLLIEHLRIEEERRRKEEEKEFAARVIKDEQERLDLEEERRNIFLKDLKEETGSWKKEDFKAYYQLRMEKREADFLRIEIEKSRLLNDVSFREFESTEYILLLDENAKKKIAVDILLLDENAKEKDCCRHIVGNQRCLQLNFEMKMERNFPWS